MLNYAVDIALILVSGSACLYCFMLNRRLKALQDMEKGLGASIVSFTQAVSKLSLAAQEAKRSVADSTQTLRSLLVKVDTSIPKIDGMLENLDHAANRTATETREMHEELVRAIRPLLDEAHEKAENLTTVIDHLDRHRVTLQQSTLGAPRNQVLERQAS
jgi:ABC-type transporter Mla subunit MlaD